MLFKSLSFDVMFNEVVTPKSIWLETKLLCAGPRLSISNQTWGWEGTSSHGISPSYHLNRQIEYRFASFVFRATCRAQQVPGTCLLRDTPPDPVCFWKSSGIRWPDILGIPNISGIPKIPRYPRWNKVPRYTWTNNFNTSTRPEPPATRPFFSIPDPNPTDIEKKYLLGPGYMSIRCNNCW